MSRPVTILGPDWTIFRHEPMDRERLRSHMRGDDVGCFIPYVPTTKEVVLDGIPEGVRRAFELLRRDPSEASDTLPPCSSERSEGSDDCLS